MGVDNLKEFVRKMEAMQDNCGEFEGLFMPFYGRIDPASGNIVREHFDGESDAMFSSSYVLAAQCLRYKLAFAEHDKTEQILALRKIDKIISAIRRMQRILGDGMICRNMSTTPRDGWASVKDPQSGEVLYYQTHVTYDQILSLMFGLYHVEMIKDIIPLSPSNIYGNTLDIVQKIGKHFLKYEGFIGLKTNLRIYPWYIEFQLANFFLSYKNMNKTNWFESFFNRYVVLWINFLIFFPLSAFVKVIPKNMIYSLAISNVLFQMTKGTDYKEFHDDLAIAYQEEIEQEKTFPCDHWFVKKFMKFAYNVREHGAKFWKWFGKLPDDIIISGKHVENRIGVNLNELSKYMLDSTFVIGEFNDDLNGTLPFYYALYKDDNFLKENKEYLDKLMRSYRGPRMKYVVERGVDDSDIKMIKVLNYDGTVKNLSEKALMADRFRFHCSGFAQSSPYEFNDGVLADPNGSFDYESMGTYLYSYYSLRLKGILDGTV